jgi:hypothetical protein
VGRASDKRNTGDAFFIMELIEKGGGIPSSVRVDHVDVVRSCIVDFYTIVEIVIICSSMYKRLNNVYGMDTDGGCGCVVIDAMQSFTMDVYCKRSRVDIDFLVYKSEVCKKLTSGMKDDLREVLSHNVSMYSLEYVSTVECIAKIVKDCISGNDTDEDNLPDGSGFVIDAIYVFIADISQEFPLLTTHMDGCMVYIEEAGSRNISLLDNDFNFEGDGGLLCSVNSVDKGDVSLSLDVSDTCSETSHTSKNKDRRGSDDSTSNNKDRRGSDDSSSGSIDSSGRSTRRRI